MLRRTENDLRKPGRPPAGALPSPLTAKPWKIDKDNQLAEQGAAARRLVQETHVSSREMACPVESGHAPRPGGSRSRASRASRVWSCTNVKGERSAVSERASTGAEPASARSSLRATSKLGAPLRSTPRSEGVHARSLAAQRPRLSAEHPGGVGRRSRCCWQAIRGYL